MSEHARTDIPPHNLQQSYSHAYPNTITCLLLISPLILKHHLWSKLCPECLLITEAHSTSPHMCAVTKISYFHERERESLQVAYIIYKILVICIVN